ncbi:MAG: TIR domain-containing protein, partial [Chloroflexota bacterium]
MTIPDDTNRKIFISYSHRDGAFAERLRMDIEQAGLSVWIDHEELQPGTPDWEKAIRAAIKAAESVVYVASEAAFESNFCQGELAVARSYKRKIYPVFAQGDEFVKCIPLDMGRIQFVDMRDEARYNAGLPRLLKAFGVQQTRMVEAAPAAEPENVPVPDDFEPTNPYKGLEAFTAEDRTNFFGRSALVRTLTESVEKFTTERFLALVGPSGAGKSSVVMAGLLPTLSDDHPDWIFLPRIVPGDHPLEALAIMLHTQLGGGAITDYERDLRNPDTRGLIKQTKALTTESTQRIVLFIDQFEELFTQTPGEHEAERRQFIDLLITAALDPRTHMVVILTLRADFTDRALTHAELTRLLQNHTQFIPPLNLADLREVIEEPARHQHLTFDSDLVADLVYAVRDQVGALPLLQFTLDQLYQRRDGLKLTRTAYNEIGGLRGALAKHAEQTYLNLPNSIHYELARWLFLRLLEVGSTAQDTTRRRVTHQDLIPERSEDLPRLVDTVLDTFIGARLLTVSEDKTFEVAHEALLREWPRLLGWINDARADLPTQNVLHRAVADWREAGEKLDDDEHLARPGRLRDFQDWVSRNRPSDIERRYIEASQAWQAELFAREEHHKKELLDITNRARIARWTAEVVGVVATIIVVIAALSFVTVQQAANTANSRAQLADTQVAIVAATLTPIPSTLTAVAQQVKEGKNLSASLQMAAYANTVLQDNKADKLPAVLLDIRGLKAAYSPQADASLVVALESSYGKKGFIGHTDSVTSVAFNPDGDLALTGSADDTAQLWEVASRRSVRILSGHTGGVTSVAFSPDGKLALTGSDDGTARLWDVASGQTVRSLSGHTDGVTSVAFSPDGKLALTGSDDGTARLWDVASGQTVRSLSGHTGGVTSVAFSPDGKLALTGGDTARLWDVASGQTVRSLSGHMGKVWSVAFSPDGKLALTGSADHTAQLWDVASGQTVRILTGHTSRVWSVAFSPDGRYILTGSGDDTARLWDVANGQSIRTLTGHTNVVISVAFSPDGRYILTGSGDDTARLWELAGGQSVRSLSVHMNDVTSVAFSPDGRYILTGSGDSTARLWDVASGQTVRILSGHTDRVWSVALSLDGKSALTGSDDGTARLWDVASGQSVRILSGHTSNVTSVAFSPDGKLALTGSDDGTAQLWDVVSGQSEQILKGHTSGVTSVAFSPDGQSALTGSFDGTTWLWDVASGQTVRILSGHTSNVTSV